VRAMVGGVVLSPSGIVAGSKCFEDSMRPECKFLCILGHNEASCVSSFGCNRIEEQALLNKLDSIRLTLEAADEMGILYPTRSDVRLLLQVIGDLQKKVSGLEAKIFDGVDPKNRTNMIKLSMDLMRMAEEDDLEFVDNKTLMALVKRYQA